MAMMANNQVLEQELDIQGVAWESMLACMADRCMHGRKLACQLAVFAAGLPHFVPSQAK